MQRHFFEQPEHSLSLVSWLQLLVSVSSLLLIFPLLLSALAAPAATGTLTASVTTSLQNLRLLVPKCSCEGGHGSPRWLWPTLLQPIRTHGAINTSLQIDRFCDFDRLAEYATSLRPALSALINFRAGAHPLVESDRWLTSKPPRPPKYCDVAQPPGLPSQDI